MPDTASLVDGGGVWIAIGLISLATVAGAWLARRNSQRIAVWLAIASAVMLVVAVTDMLPDAWRHAVEAGVPLWVIGFAVAIGYLVITYFTRKGCGCASETPARSGGAHAPGGHRRLKEAAGAAMFGGMGTAAALSVHRAIEGATLALGASAVVAVALIVHSASEGLALTALLDIAKQRLTPWLIVACASPALGVLAAEVSPLPGSVIPVLLGMIAGVLLRTAIVGFRLAAREQEDGRLPRRHLILAVTVAVLVGGLLELTHRRASTESDHASGGTASLEPDAYRHQRRP